MCYIYVISPFYSLQSTILYCEAKKEENIRIFSSDLNSLVRETRFTLMTLRNVVRDPLLISSETLSLVALEKIKGNVWLLFMDNRLA